MKHVVCAQVKVDAISEKSEPKMDPTRTTWIFRRRAFFLRLAFVAIVWALVAVGSFYAFFGADTGSYSNFCLREGQTSWFSYAYYKDEVCEVDIGYMLALSAPWTMLILALIYAIAVLVAMIRR